MRLFVGLSALPLFLSLFLVAPEARGSSDLPAPVPAVQASATPVVEQLS